MKTDRRHIHFVLLLLLTALSGCAQNRLLSTWHDPGLHGPVQDPILVMGGFKNLTARKIYEDSFVQNIEKTGIQALPGYRFGDRTTVPGKEQLRRIISQSGAKSVLITSLLRKKTVKEKLPSLEDDEIVYAYWSKATGYMTDRVDEEFADSQDVSRHIYTMEAILFDGATGRRLWAARSRSINLNDFLRKDDNRLEELFVRDMQKHSLLPQAR
jgi:hypothetical protein